MNTPTSLRLGRGLSFGLSLILCLSFFTACKSQQMNGKKILSDQFEKIEFFKGNYLVQKGNLKGTLQRKRKRNHALQIQEHHDVSWRMAGRDVSNQKLRAIVFC